MRTLAQVLAYHFSKSIGASTFSFESINADIMNNERTREHLSNILDETKKFLVYLASVLRKELHCDNFRMLPETSSFWPIIQLIIRFPGLMDGEKGVTASLALRLLLADKQKKELLKLAAGVNESQNVKEALELFEKDSDLTSGKIEKTISRGIKNANSPMNRFTLIFYWLLRSREAKDFSYDKNISPEKADELRKRYGGTEAKLCESVEAEKNHIVPYARLKKVFNLENKGRPGRHKVHNIGNLTYISHGLNYYKTGIGSGPLKLEKEPSDNLKAHLLMDQKGELLKAYNNACRFADTESPQKDFKKAEQYFHEFLKEREKLITEAFHSWEGAIFRDRRLSDSIDEMPAERLIKPEIGDVIRGFGYPPNVKSILVKLFKMKGMSKSGKQGTDLSKKFMRKVDKRRSVQVIRFDLYRSPQRIKIKLSDGDLQKWFEKNVTYISLVNQKFEFDVNEPRASEVVSMIFEKLKKIKLSGS